MCVCVCVCVLSHVRLLATPWTAAYQAPPSMGFSRQEYWSGLPLPSPRGKKRTCPREITSYLYKDLFAGVSAYTLFIKVILKEKI